MNNNQLSIQTPEGHEIDVNNSDLAKGIIKFKPLAATVVGSWAELGSVGGYWVGADCKVLKTVRDWDKSNEDKNVFKTEGQALASLALSQLSQLKADVNGEWVPEWSNGAMSKYVIEICYNTFKVTTTIKYNNFLTFKDEETAIQFLDNHKTLIMQALPLMS